MFAKLEEKNWRGIQWTAHQAEGCKVLRWYGKMVSEILHPLHGKEEAITKEKELVRAAIDCPT